MNLAHWLVRQAKIGPARPALFLGTDCVADYQTFSAQAFAVAGWLSAQGVCPGDRVGVFMKNVPEYLVVFYGIWIAGAAVVPINAKLHGREAAYIVKDCKADVVFATSELVGLLSASDEDARIIDVQGPEFDIIRRHRALDAMVERAPSDLAWLFYTSGTTGKPKGVMITHRMLMVMSLCYEADVDPVSGADSTLYAAPMSHGAGIYNMLHVRAGARHVCPRSGGFDPEEIFDLALHYGSV